VIAATVKVWISPPTFSFRDLPLHLMVNRWGDMNTEFVGNGDAIGSFSATYSRWAGKAFFSTQSL
jgi:hypothetical protein